jgi:hypothetical protein
LDIVFVRKVIVFVSCDERQVGVEVHGVAAHIGILDLAPEYDT